MGKKKVKKLNGGQPANTNSNQDQEGNNSALPSSVNRRQFLSGVGGVTAVTLSAGAISLPPLLGARAGRVLADDIGPLNPLQRRNQAFSARLEAALAQRNRPLPDHPTNGDEDRFLNRIANYSKGLPHNSLGEVDLRAYNALLAALSSGAQADFENVPLAGAINLKNPQSGLAFDLIGPDSHHLGTPPPPTFDSAQAAGEVGELYWQALARDVAFTDYDSHMITNEAARDLSTFSDFRGPQAGGRVTTDTLFRVDIPGVLVGPFLSQFFLKNVPAGPQLLDQRINALLPVDYLTSYDDWLNSQNGQLSEAALNPGLVYDPTPRFIRNGRDLAEAVHWDWPAQAAINALLIIFGLRGASAAEIFLANVGVPYNPGNPYLRSETQGGFVTFHVVQAVAIVATAMNIALKAAWYQKWYVHRHRRPEEYGGRIHNRITRSEAYPIHADILNSPVLAAVFRRYGSYLLPQAFPEGAPCHPAYTSGHATWAGATVTMMKAFFDETAVIPNPVVASPDGLSLTSYTGPGADRLTVGGELNKLAWNIAIGRNFAGIHWRSDALEGLRLGEQVALGILRDLNFTYNEPFAGFTFTLFDGSPITL